MLASPQAEAVRIHNDPCTLHIRLVYNVLQHALLAYNIKRRRRLVWRSVVGSGPFRVEDDNGVADGRQIWLTDEAALRERKMRSR